MSNKLTKQPVIQVGDNAPLWSAQSTEGNINLADYLGQMAVLLVFYPADWNDVCNEKLPLLEELLNLEHDLHLKAFGISSDGLSSHKAFARQLGLRRVTLISDNQQQIAQAYGVMAEDGMCHRACVLIDKEGVVRWLRVEPDRNQPRPLAELEEAIRIAQEWSEQSTDPTQRQQRKQDAMQLRREKPLAPPTTLQLRFWGTRGSIPVSGPEHTRYGGNTSCVSLTSDTGHLFIFDCGSGARELGRYLLSPDWPPAASLKPQNGKKTIEGYLLLSHSHWDHIQGFPFFVPVFQPGNRFNIIGWSSCSQTMAGILTGQMEQIYFPVNLVDLPSELNFYSIQFRDAGLDGARVSGQLLKHPIPSTAFRVELGGKTFVYATDHEPHSVPSPDQKTLWDEQVIDKNLVDLARNADVLIYDAQYAVAELANKVGWGHNSGEVGVDTAIKAGVKLLVLFHHDPGHDDAMIDSLLAAARRRAAMLGNTTLEIIAAHDGLDLDFKLSKD